MNLKSFLCIFIAIIICGSNILAKDGVYTNKDGKKFFIVPPSQTILNHISNKIGPEYAQIFNSTGKKLKSFKRKESAAVQWQIMAEKLIKAVQSVPSSNSTVVSAFAKTAIPQSIQKGPKYQLLCVHFASSNHDVLNNIRKNVAASADWCRWAVIFYVGDEKIIAAFETEVRRILPNNIAFIGKYMAQPLEETGSEYVPKPLLYRMLLPLLPDYKRTWLLDADMSISDFEFANYFSLLKCTDAAYVHSPIFISQPVIRESTQDFPIFNLASWGDSASTLHHISTNSILSIRYDTIEQQAPMFDSSFLLWFVRQIIEPHRSFFVNLGSDWGLDDIWCRAAREFYHFAKHRSRISSDSWTSDVQQGLPPLCAVLIAAPISHLGSRNVSGSAIPTKHTKAPLKYWRFQFGGFLLNKIFSTRFPMWVKQSSAVKETVESLLSPNKRSQYPVLINCSITSSMIHHSSS